MRSSCSITPGLAVSAVLWLVLECTRVHAEQRRDYMLDFQPAGTFALVDYFGTGAQLTLEHRLRLYGSSNDLTLGASTIASYPLGEVHARADLRLLFLSFGTSIAYRSVWRDLSFDQDKDGNCVKCDRGARRDRDSFFGRSPGSQNFAWMEARASLLFPINEYVVMSSTAAIRQEDRRDRSFDWIFASIYDRGLIGRFETQLFVKGRDWGGIGPYVQFLFLPRGDHHDTQLAAGFNATTRLGLVDRNDLLFLTFLCRPGDSTYGQHSYFSPIRALLVYRLIFDL